MNRKFEDQLVRLAFGDLSSEEASRLQAESAEDRDAQRTLDTYRQMKSELQSLAEVPADQLSKERLREAILARGLGETKAASRQWNWLWMPAMAAAVAFGVVFLKGSTMPDHSVATTVVMDEPKSMSWTDLPKFDFSTTPIRSAAVTPSVSVSADVEETPVKKSQPTQVRRAHHEAGPTFASATANMSLGALDTMSGHDMPSGIGEALAPAMDKVEKTDKQVPQPDGPTAAITSSPSPISSAGARTIEKSSSIVLIQPEKDQDTGAQRAREVESASNVLVGG